MEPPEPPIDLVPDELASEPASPPPAPTMTIWLAFLWAVLLVGLQLPLVLPVIVIAQAGNPRVLLALLPAATLSLLFAAGFIVYLTNGTRVRRRFAIRKPAAMHLLIAVALVPAFQASAELVQSAAASGYRAAGVPDNFLQPPDLYGQFAEAAGSLPVWLNLGVVLVFGALLPAAGEELFFRGFLGRGLLARYGAVVGVVWTSVLFGLMHANLVHSVVTFTMGLFLHAVYLWTRSLVAVAVVHAGNNAVGFLMGDVLARVAPRLAGAGEFPLSVQITSVVAVAGGLTYLCVTRVRWQLPDGSEWSPGYATAATPPARTGAIPVRFPAGKLRWATAAGFVLFVTVLAYELSRG